MFPIGNVHSIKVVVLDDLVVRFDKGFGIMHIHKSDLVIHRLPERSQETLQAVFRPAIGNQGN